MASQEQEDGVDSMWMTWSNKPDAAKPAITSRLHSGYHWRGLADPER
jgi:hypothetical protein